MKTKYYLRYVENNSPALRMFSSKKELNAFVKKFEKDDSQWLEFSFETTKKVTLLDEVEEVLR